MKYLSELPAIVSDARATFHGLNEAEINNAPIEMKAGIAMTFESNVMLLSARNVKITYTITATVRKIETVLPRKRTITLWLIRAAHDISIKAKHANELVANEI
jgi:hypothetical protein